MSKHAITRVRHEPRRRVVCDAIEPRKRAWNEPELLAQGRRALHCERIARDVRVTADERRRVLGIGERDHGVHLRDAGARAADGIEHRSIEGVPLDALQIQTDHFLRSVREGVQPLVTGEDGLLALKYARIVREKIDERAAWKSPTGHAFEENPPL